MLFLLQIGGFGLDVVSIPGSGDHVVWAIWAVVALARAYVDYQKIKSQSDKNQNSTEEIENA